MFTDLVRDIEERTRKPRVLECKELPKGYILLDHGSGAPLIKELPAERRCYNASSFAGLVEMIAYLHKEADENESTCVFLGEMVTVCLDERGRRRDLGTMTLEMSEQMYSIMHMQDEQPMSQRDAIWLLTSRFRHNILTADFLPIIRNLKFRTSTEGTARIQHGAESLGSSIDEEALTGNVGGELPDMVEFEVPVFEFLDIDFAPAARIRCAVKFNIQEKSIVIRPEPGQVALARARALTEISDVLRKKVPPGVSVLTCANFATA